MATLVERLRGDIAHFRTRIHPMDESELGRIARIEQAADALTEALQVVREAREDFAAIEAEMAFPNQMEAGFVHGKPTLKDMTQRVELAKSIASVANAGLTAFLAQHEGEAK